MALEDALAALSKQVAALTDEVQKNNDITAKLLAARTDAIESVRSAAAPAAKPASKTTKAADPEPVKEPEAVKEPEPKAEAPKAEAPKPAAQAPTAELPAEDDLSDDALKAHVAYYVRFGSSEENPLPKEAREERMGKIREVLANPKVNAKVVAEVPQNARRAFRKKIAQFIEELAPAAEADEMDDL